MPLLLSACGPSSRQLPSQSGAIAPRPEERQCLAGLGERHTGFTPLPDRYFAPGCAGINTVLRAMAEQINRRRFRQAEERHYAQPKRAPRTRHERQTVNYNAPVVAKARLTEEPRKPMSARPKAVKTAKPEKTVVAAFLAKAETPKQKKLGPKEGLRLAKAKAAKAKLEEEKIRPKGKTAKAKAARPIGRAKAKPRTLSRTAKRARKSGKR